MKRPSIDRTIPNVTKLLCYSVAALVTLSVAACSPASGGESAATAAAPATPTVAAPATPIAEATPAPTEAPAAEQASVPAPSEVAEGAASELAPEERANMFSALPEMQIDPAKYYYATFKTERGDIKVQLFADRAPVTVNNFVYLARAGYYNDTTFHRVLADFMAQGGDPTGTGAGGPGYQFQDEIDASLVFDRAGLLAMANAGPGTNGSQFFITFGPTEWLNGRHTIFGEAIEGMDVLKQLTLRDPNQNPNEPGDTLYTVLIEEGDESALPTPLPPTPTPTPFAPSAAEAGERPLATVEPAARANYYNTAPELVIDPAKTYTATVATTQGEFVIELYANAAPIAVNNFVLLANLGFYDGLPVNQNSPDNALIFGAPDNTPQNDVGYKIAAELNLTGTLDIGSVSYIPFQLPTGELAASGSQLLIARIVPPAEANSQFSFFAKVVDGVDVLTLLTTDDTIESVIVTESE